MSGNIPTAMQITVKLFASLQRYLPATSSELAATVDVADGATVAEVLQQLHVPAAKAHLVLRNGSFVAPAERTSTPLIEGDVIALWPPVAGG